MSARSSPADKARLAARTRAAAAAANAVAWLESSAAISELQRFGSPSAASATAGPRRLYVAPGV